MRLRKSTVGGPGFRRIRRGPGFSYLNNDRHRVDDAEVLARIEALVGVPVNMISTGPDRNQTIFRKHPFA